MVGKVLEKNSAGKKVECGNGAGVQLHWGRGAAALRPGWAGSGAEGRAGRKDPRTASGHRRTSLSIVRRSRPSHWGDSKGTACTAQTAVGFELREVTR